VITRKESWKLAQSNQYNLRSKRKSVQLNKSLKSVITRKESWKLAQSNQYNLRSKENQCNQINH